MIIEDLPFEDYLDLPGWNWSLLKLLANKSPRHIQHAINAPDNDTASRGYLRAVHSLVLEPHRFDEDFTVYDGVRNKRHKAYQAFLETVGSKTVLSVTDNLRAFETAKAINTHPAVVPLLSKGRPELTITWTDEATGLDCKGRIDWLTAESIVDLKTIGGTDERHVSRIVAQNLYHGQMAHYRAGLAANGVHVDLAHIVAAEGSGAQDVAVYELDDGAPHGALYVGEKLRSRLMEHLAECVHFDRWPGRHETVQTLVLPTYALEETDETITFGETHV